MIHNKVYVVYKNDKLIPMCFGRPGIYFRKRCAEAFIRFQKTKRDDSKFEIKEYYLGGFEYE